MPKRMSEVMFAWSYQEYVKEENSVQWYVYSLLLLAAGIAWCVYDNNLPFGMFLVLFYLVVLLYNHIHPETVKFVIAADGIKIGKNFHYFREFDHFFIVYEEAGIKNLYLQFRNPFRGRLTVPLDGQDAVAIRRFMLKYLREDLEREAEPISERLKRWMKL